MAQAPYTKATTFTVDCETVPNGDIEAQDALAVPYVWPSVNEARETVRIMTTINRFPYNRYETREGTVYAFTEYGAIISVIFLERRERLCQAVRQAARPMPRPAVWEGYNRAYGTSMRVDLYRDAATGSWAVLVRVWNTFTGEVYVNETTWHDEDFDAARVQYSEMTALYTPYNG